MMKSKMMASGGMMKSKMMASGGMKKSKMMANGGMAKNEEMEEEEYKAGGAVRKKDAVSMSQPVKKTVSGETVSVRGVGAARAQKATIY
jgi:hypothetical protein